MPFGKDFEMVAFVGISQGDVQLLDIAVGVGAGMLLVTGFQLTVLLNPPCILIFARGGFAARLHRFCLLCRVGVVYSRWFG